MTRSRPAVILTLQRSGGSFLAYCLSNHPDVFCARGEPMGGGGFWRRVCPDKLTRLELLLLRPYHRVGMCKLMEGHAFDGPVWTWLNRQNPPVKVVALRRENIVAQAVSHEINAARLCGHPTHAFGPVDPPPVRVDPDDVLARCRTDVERYACIDNALAGCGLDTLRLTYRQITGDKDAEQVPQPVATAVCDFLDVPYARLYTRMRKVHTRPLAETVTNWDEVCARLRGTEFERFL